MTPDRKPPDGAVRSADAAAIRILRWMGAALLLLNGGALIAVTRAHGLKGLFDSGGRSFAAGLLSALAGALFWTLAYSALSRERRTRSWDAAQPAEAEPDQQETGELPKTLCAIAIMLWVGALTGFITGCES
jgi:drug/metabolite transporter (DMT)-like permease